MDSLSAETERLFHRLVVTVDDHGRFDADARVVLAECFPLRVGRWKPMKVEGWLQELVEVGTVVLYEINGRRYGFFPGWSLYQRVRTTKSKFPAPPPSAAERRESPQPADNGGHLRPVVQESRVQESRVQESVHETNKIVRRKDGFTIPSELLERWKTSYPGVDVLTEVRDAFEWEAAVPSRRKERIQAFLVRWLKKAQSQAPAKPIPTAPQLPAVLMELPMTPEQLAENRARFSAMSRDLTQRKSLVPS